MSQSAQNKFEEAREKLATALKNLEEIITKKIDESSINAKIIDASNSDDSRLESQIIQQSLIIKNLNEELNKLQKNMAEIEKENDFFKDKNNFFADKVFKFKTQGSALIQAVENDLINIKEIITSEK